VAVKAGQVALPHDYDGHLIRRRARLLAMQTERGANNSRALTLERRNMRGKETIVFRALFDDMKMKSLGELVPGSELEITGLVQLDYAPNNLQSRITRTVPVGLDLILRNPADVVVLSKRSWWTAEHLTAVLATVVLALGGALVWSLQLKRQVRRKTKLFEAIRECHAGGRPIGENVARLLAAGSEHGFVSRREMEVLGLVRQGFTNAEVGRLLGISERTAKAHVAALLVKLQASDRAEAVARGFERGLLKP
jgi:DNA-binding CsgD family transcriptional regulator